MKIVIEEAKINQYSGIGKYYYNILNSLLDLGITPIIYPKDFLYYNNPIIRRIKYFFWLNFIFTFKLFLLSLKDEVIVIGVNYYVPFFKIPRVKYYPVIHDLIAFKQSQYIPAWNRFIISLLTFNAIRVADKIFTVSETAKNDIIQTFNYDREKVKVIFNTFSLDNEIKIDENFILEKYRLYNKQYFLSVSSSSPHKNINSLVQAFKEFYKKNKGYKLVLVGNGDNCSEECIVYTGVITDEELKVLYKNAKIYIFPSIAEGFGIPIIDAQNFGVPIICSDIEVFREVTGGIAEFTSFDSMSINKKMQYLVDNDFRCNKLIEDGKKNISRFKKNNIKEQIKNLLGLL